MLRALAMVTSIAFAGALFLGGLVLLGSPVAKLVPAAEAVFGWGLPVPAVIMQMEVPVVTHWGSASLRVEDARGSLRLPLGAIPWWLFSLLWAHTAAAFVLVSLFLHHLRRLLQRARDGDVFNRDNVSRLRRLGTLLIYFGLMDLGVGSLTSWLVRPRVSSDVVEVAVGLHGNGALMLAAFVLWVLAEVFRRGTDLESEQSLVV